MSRRLIAGLILSLFVVSCKTTQPLNQSKLVQAKMDQFVKDQALTGMSFSIILPENRQESFTSGYSDVETKEVLKTKHLLLSGSVGKTYAVALLMKLIDDNKVQLNDLYKDYFPEIEWLDRIPNIDQITVEMLLQHTSGLPRWVLKPEVWNTLNKDPDKFWTYFDRLFYVFDEDPVHEAGKGWAYSDTNYILLGLLIQKLLNSNYYLEIYDQLLIPYKLKKTAPSNKREIKNLASAYSQLPEVFKMPDKVANKGEYIFNPQVEWTGGGMASSTADLAKWCKLYYEGELFSDQLLTKITTINPNGKAVMGTDSYGMGSFIYETKFGKAYGHSGFMPGFISLMVYFPEKQLAAAIQFNCDYAAQNKKLMSYMEDLLQFYQ